MPQMAPLSWINLFIMFVMTFMIMNSLNYFSFSYQNKSSSYLKAPSKTNWKW